MASSCCGEPRKNNAGVDPTCVDCATLGCARNNGSYPAFCETSALGDGDISRIREAYEANPDTYEFMKAASQTNARGFADQLCRAEETMDYAHRMGYKKIGIAFCAGVAEEARIFAQILRVHGYEVVGIVCKVGAMGNADMGLEESCCNFGTVSCNPLVQVNRLNEEKTDLNVIMGLCVGHDAFFCKYSDAPCTTLMTKDKAMVNNPGAAIWAATTASLYSRMMRRDESLAAVED